METAQLEIKAAIQILKPVDEVFEAIVDPGRMSGYFIAFGSGRMEDGARLTWKFPEFEEESLIRVVKVETNKYISFYWQIEGKDLLVEIQLTSLKEGYTLVRVTEKEMENNPAGINWLKGNTEGWANFLACLKAYIEYGINLRKGAFDFMKA
ncbi:SRPBCC domain-containing protein [Pedobacter sp. AW31-3R]|uniref:SRPBCC domain-containing protein n=1 Tax=Pedobacter sp. AW31-3R TaxID=3445781 RepID=UPI003F9FAA36